MDAYIVIAVMVLMIIAFVLNKWSFGLITMTCCIILGVTGVLDTATAFSGLCNPMIVMLAGSFVVTNALSRTSFIKALQNRIMQLQNGKSGMSLMFVFALAVVVLATFLPTVAVLTILLMMARNLSSEGEVNAARVLFPAAMMTTAWSLRIPIGTGAAQFAILNGFTEAYGEEYAVGIFAPLLAVLVPGILIILYYMFCYKFLPKKQTTFESELSSMGISMSDEKMSRRDEIITYVVFIIMLIFMFFNQWTGELLYIGPALCAAVLIFVKVVTIEEVKMTITSDMIFMMAGIFTLTAALSSTGGGEMIGNAIVSLVGGVETEFGLAVVFAAIAIVVTNLMSNTATMYTLIPVAITTGIAAGVNPVPAMMAIDVASKCACMLPCSSGESAFCYAVSGYKLTETMKYNIPAVILYFVGTLAGIYFFFC